mgnify:CR=1 FL=1|jgi:large subunit ribosomal protein L24
MAKRIKKGDRVFVNCGKDSGKIGEVMRLQGYKAIVKDVNISKKHQKQDQNSQGGITNKEMPIAIDNLMLLNKKDNKPTRVQFKTLKDNKKVRIAVSSGEQIDG